MGAQSSIFSPLPKFATVQFANVGSPACDLRIHMGDDFVGHPSHPARADRHPLGELPRSFQPVQLPPAMTRSVLGELLKREDPPRPARRVPIRSHGYCPFNVV